MIKDESTSKKLKGLKEAHRVIGNLQIDVTREIEKTN